MTLALLTSAELAPQQSNPLSLTIERGRRFTRILTIAEQYRQGTKVDVIADAFECSKGTVLRIARLFELEKRARGNAYLKKCCIKAYKRGCSLKAIGAACQRSEAWVSQTAGQRGILRRHFKSRAL